MRAVLWDWLGVEEERLGDCLRLGEMLSSAFTAQVEIIDFSAGEDGALRDQYWRDANERPAFVALRAVAEAYDVVIDAITDVRRCATWPVGHAAHAAYRPVQPALDSLVSAVHSFVTKLLGDTAQIVVLTRLLDHAAQAVETGMAVQDRSKVVATGIVARPTNT